MANVYISNAVCVIVLYGHILKAEHKTYDEAFAYIGLG
jgi:hypothetical protein